MFEPDIQTSLQLSPSRFGLDMQSLLFWIFQVPVHFRPISLLRSTPPAHTLPIPQLTKATGLA